MLEKYFFIFSEIFLLQYFFRVILNGECYDNCIIVLIFFSVLIYFIFLFLLYFWFNKLISNILAKKIKVNSKDFFFIFYLLICGVVYIFLFKEIFFLSLQINFFNYISFYLFSVLVILYLFLFYILVKQFLFYFFKNFYLKYEKKYFFFNCKYFFYFLVIVFFFSILINYQSIYSFLGFFLPDANPSEYDLLTFLEEYIPEYEELLKEIQIENNRRKK